MQSGQLSTPQLGFSRRGNSLYSVPSKAVHTVQLGYRRVCRRVSTKGNNGRSKYLPGCILKKKNTSPYFQVYIYIQIHSNARVLPYACEVLQRSTDKSTYQSFDRSVSQPSHHPTKQPMRCSMSLGVNHPVSQFSEPTYKKSFRQATGQTTN